MTDIITQQIAAELDRADHVAELNAAAAELVAMQDGQAIAVWATPSGKERVAYTPRAYEDAPSKVRKSEAFARTVAQLKNGLYNSFVKDALGALTKGHKAALAAHLNRHCDMPVNPVTGDNFSFDADSIDRIQRVNKALFHAIAQYLAAPRAIVRKVEQDKALAKSKQWISDAAAAWLAAQGDKIAE